MFPCTLDIVATNISSPGGGSGTTTDHYGTNIGPVSKELPQLKSNNGGDACFICSNDILILQSCILCRYRTQIPSVPSLKESVLDYLELKSWALMGTVETPHHVPRRVQLNHSTLVGWWWRIPSKWLLQRSSFLYNFSFSFVPSSKSGVRRKHIIIKFSGKYIYSGTRQLNISGHILVSTRRTNQRTSPNTPGHQKDICWHLRWTDGRI